MTPTHFEMAIHNARRALEIERQQGERANDRFQLMCAAFIELAEGLDEEFTAIHDRIDQIEEIVRQRSEGD